MKIPHMLWIKKVETIACVIHQSLVICAFVQYFATDIIILSCDNLLLFIAGFR